jgi:sugar phosphate isomerase/epimerase
MERHDQDALSRRRFLQAGTAALAALGLTRGGLTGCARCSKAKIPVGLQLYSVRFECEKNFEKTVEAVAKMGYEGVEFAGFYNRGAEAIRRLLDDNGLKCCGSHTPLDALSDEAFEKTVQFNKILGNRYLIIPWIPEEMRKTRRDWLELAKRFDALTEKAGPYHMRIGYHNHNFEFTPVEGDTPWDLLFSHTSRRVIMQVDTGNALSAGADAVPILNKYPGRAATIHLKDYSKTRPDALLGEGDVDWKGVFVACEGAGGTEWYIVEDESLTGSPLDRVQKDLAALRAMGR